MIDRDLAELYGVENRVLNQAVKRNMERFPERFRFQLTKEEMAELVANCDRFNSLKHSAVRSYAFTEQGVAMLSKNTKMKMKILFILTLCFCINSKAQCKSDYSIYENTISVLYEKLLKDKVLCSIIE